MTTNATPTRHAILTIRGATPTLSVQRDVAQDLQVVRLSDEHILPPRASDLADSARATLARFCHIESDLLSTQVQMSPSSGRYHYGEVTLTLSAEASPAAVERCRDAAVHFCRLIGAVSPVTAQASIAALSDAPEEGAGQTPLMHEDLRLASFLGARIPVPLELLVPDRATHCVQGRFSRSPSRSASDVVHEVLGHLCTVNIRAKKCSVGVSGRSLSDGRLFSNEPITISRSQLPKVGAALIEQERLLRLWINVRVIDEGRAVPRRTNTLVRLEFDTTEEGEALAATRPAAPSSHTRSQAQTGMPTGVADSANASSLEKAVAETDRAAESLTATAMSATALTRPDSMGIVRMA